MLCRIRRKGTRERKNGLKMLSSGAQILVNCLEEQGVQNIFGYPGASILPVYDCLASSSIRHVLTAHEQGACFAAEGYARRSGKAGVVLATSGPGATNLLTGIADAYMDSVPLVAVTGNVPLDQLGHDSFQEVDVFDMSMPVTKYSIIVKRATDLAAAVRKAFLIAESGRKGPVLVDIPCNVFSEYADYAKCQPEKPALCAPDEEEIRKAAQAIATAKRPVIYAGGGIKWSGAEHELAGLAQKLRAPVTVSYMGVLCNTNFKTSSALRECDLLITLGARFNSRYAAFSALKKRRTPLLQLDADKAEIDKNILTTASVTGDLKLSLSKLLPLVEERDAAEEWEFRSLPDLSEENCGIDIIKCLCRNLGPSATVTTDVGLHQEWAAHNCKVYNSRRFLTSGGLGAMGFGLGAAIGAHFASGDVCLLITGDGSFNMNFNEITTAVKHHVPLVVAVLNNNSLGMIRKLQSERRAKTSGISSLYLNVDYAALAQSMGARGVTVEEFSDLDAVIDDALEGSLPLVIDFKIPINTGI